MSDEAAFLQAIQADPDNDNHRLIFADWLEEQGESAKAECLRLECELADMAETNERYRECEKRLRQLREEVSPEWLKLVGIPYAVVMVSFKPPDYTITAIKHVREITSWGLKEVKDFIISLPGVLAANLGRAEAETLQLKVMSPDSRNPYYQNFRVSVALLPMRDLSELGIKQ